MTRQTLTLGRHGLVIAAVATIGLLPGCGKHEAATATANATAGGAAEALTPGCFIAVGHLPADDARLFEAAGAGDLATLDAAIASQGKVDARDALKRTPLFAAAFCNHPRVVDRLIEHGAKIDATDFLGMSPLHAATLVGGLGAAQALLAKGANINSQTESGRTALYLATMTGQPAMKDLLVAHGALVQPSGGHAATAAPPAIGK
jgi:hypothetical protein